MDIISRAKNICLTPATEWPVIEAENTSTGTLITGYVLPLAAIPAVAGFIGGSLIGYTMPFVGTYRTPLVAGLGSAVLGLVMSVVACFIVAFIVNALAPTFGAQKNSEQAMKVVVYAYTPAWLAGVLQILPLLGILGVIAALYGIYLLYLGLPKLMKCPEDKSIAYTAVTVVCAIVVMLVLGAITAGVFAAGAIGSGVMGGMMGGASQTAQADPDSFVGRMQSIGEQMEQSAARAEEAGRRGDTEGQMGAAMEGLGALFGGGRRVEAVDLDRLRPFAPETFAGLARTSSSSERTGMAGVMVSTVKATYGEGSDAVDLEIVDTGGMSGLAGLAGAFGMEGEREDSDGSERTYREDGRLIHERSSKTGGTNEFGLMVGNRFTVSVKSRGRDLNSLKAATAGLDLAGLEGMKDVGVQQ